MKFFLSLMLCLASDSLYANTQELLESIWEKNKRPPDYTRLRIEGERVYLTQDDDRDDLYRKNAHSSTYSQTKIVSIDHIGETLQLITK